MTNSSAPQTRPPHTGSVNADLPVPAYADSSASTVQEPEVPSAVPWKAVALFFVIAIVILGLCAAPFWFTEAKIAHPLYNWVIAVGMLAPAIASVIVCRAQGERWSHHVGWRFRGRWKQIIVWSLLGSVIMIAINVACTVIMVMRGVPGDLSGLTWANQVAEQTKQSGATVPPEALLAITLAAIPLNVVLTAVFALGEEIGWRGWLRRKLAPLGMWIAVTIGGVIWSLWHLPVVALGHNYPGLPRYLAVAMFIPACVAMNYLFTAITARAGDNPIAAAFTHAALNSTMGLLLAMASTQRTIEEMNWLIDGATGATGIVLMSLVAWLIMPKDTLEKRAQAKAEAVVATYGVPAQSVSGAGSARAQAQSEDGIERSHS